jgi:hypothetical protein
MCGDEMQLFSLRQCQGGKKQRFLQTQKEIDLETTNTVQDNENTFSILRGQLLL